MENFIQVCWEHKTEIAALGAVVLSSGVHAYQVVVQAGGIRTMWANFMGPAGGVATPPAAPERSPTTPAVAPATPPAVTRQTAV